MMQGEWGHKLNHPWHGVATVTYGARQLKTDTDRITADFYGNMEKTVEILHGQNLDRVGFVMDIPFPYKEDNRWLSAYLMKQYDGQIKPIDPMLDPEPSFESFSTWFKASKPEAIICVHPPTVIGWLNRMGLKVPEDVGVVVIGKGEKDGEISGIVENNWTCGKLAVEMLLERIHRGEFGNYAAPHHVTISGQWNRGKTLRYRS
jgi:LacI family transcriptional regulator